jgi:WD40 repeat protein
VIVVRDHSSPDGQHGRSVLHADWTPDSQFLFSTASSGGHSAWHFNTFVYVRRTNKIYQLDEMIGPLVDPMFDVSTPDQFHSKRLNPNGGTDAEPIEVRVALSKLTWPN